MKLLIITDAWLPQINGVVRTYEHLIEELEQKGHEVKIISPTDFPLNFPMPGYSEIHLALFPYRRLERMIKEAGIHPTEDSIHIATEGPLGWAARKYCLRHNRSFTSSYHTHFPDYAAKRAAKLLPFLYNPVHKLAKHTIRKFHNSARLMMVATQSLEGTLKEWGFTAPMQRFTRGARLEHFKRGEKTLFNDLPRPIALYVGRVAIEKNLEEFLKMAWNGSKVIVGDGPARSDLEKKYPDAHFVGAKQGTELAEHYRSADIFVFPSRTDTFGMVLIEALASGLPVAAYNVTGPKDIITEDFLGALHEHDLAEAAKTALKNGKPDECAAHVQSFYTWEYATNQFLQGLNAKHKRANS